MPSDEAGPRFAVQVDDVALAEDLAHATAAAREAIGPMVEHVRRDGVPVQWLRRCDPEGRDGTRLTGCVKFYIPQPVGRWGAVLTGAVAAGAPRLLLVAVGQRHPTAASRPSVYVVAHRRLTG